MQNYTMIMQKREKQKEEKLNICQSIYKYKNETIFFILKLLNLVYKLMSSKLYKSMQIFFIIGKLKSYLKKNIKKKNASRLHKAIKFKKIFCIAS